MIKRLLVITVLSAVMIASIAAICSASLSILTHGCRNYYNGVTYVDRAYAKVQASGSNYTVEVGVVKSNGVISGRKTTSVTNGQTKTCYSNEVPGTSGLDASVTYYES